MKIGRPRSVLLATAFLLLTTCNCSGTEDAGLESHTPKRASVVNPACPPDEVVAWGDSLTYALTRADGTWAQADPTWLDVVGRDLGMKTENFGLPSQGSAEIAVRQGGLKPRLTLRGNEIPAGPPAAIDVTTVSPNDGWSRYGDAGVMKMHGTLLDVQGTLVHTVRAGVDAFTFIPDADRTAPVQVPSGSLFKGDDGDGYRACLQIIWAGTNNSKEPAAIARDIASMVAHLKAPRRYLIVGTVPSVIDQLSAAYGLRFVDLRSWLISDGLSAAGSNPLPSDVAAVAQGDVPPSLTVDGTHFTSAAYEAIGHHLASVIETMG
ncbi:hypothetical protein [Mycolicibacterium sp. 050158]|uniref:hypothetical protein n=1 Tax=Mycolicibacterium sp. 050158 TaxID=3090602 RepID=UPI00299CDF0D|nr:hypothetical protein [Mycolicibacterium sp. 050158]MDX1888194.1 hypothetical protein [Mycolicibacterium sp. 050158]